MTEAQIQERNERRAATSNTVCNAANVTKDKIRAALREFHDTTGLRVDDIRMTHISLWQFHIDLEIKL